MDKQTRDEEIEQLRNERDAARRWYCIYMRFHPAGVNVVDQKGIVRLLRDIETAEEVAEAHGWDCFKK
jgi:hypothetical protein